MCLDGLGGQPQPFADPAVSQTLGEQREHFALSRGEFVEVTAGLWSAEEQVDQFWIDDGFAARDAVDRRSKDRHVGDAVLEQVTGAGRIVPEQRQRVVGVPCWESTITPMVG